MNFVKMAPHEAQHRRKFPRRKFRRAVGFLCKGEYFVGLGEEIGEGGLALYLPQEFPVDQEAVLSFQLQDGSFISVRIEVRNCEAATDNQFFIGCQFKNLKFEHKREIRSYVSERSEVSH